MLYVISGRLAEHMRALDTVEAEGVLVKDGALGLSIQMRPGTHELTMRPAATTRSKSSACKIPARDHMAGAAMVVLGK